MTYFVQRNSRINGPLPRRDILAVCAYLNRKTAIRRIAGCSTDAETLLDRLAAAARMQ
jgi:hypothetical protein